VPADQRGHVEVVFDHPENFTDVQDASIPSDQGRDAILAQLRSHLEDRASSLLPKGYALTVTFTDIELAGKYESWRGPQWGNIRVVKAMYPPAFKFSFVLKDPAGVVVKQGSESIRDTSFQLRSLPDTMDPLRYEKAILSDWAEENLRNLK
jgi:hypothetical protein